jgi:hypothetical protein
MRFAAVTALAALAGSAAASPLVKREGCQMLACVIKVGPAAASCSAAIDANALDLDADIKCLKDGFEVLTNFPDECDGCIAELIAGKFDLGDLDLSSLSFEQIKEILKNLDLGIDLPTLPSGLPDLGDIFGTGLPDLGEIFPSGLPNLGDIGDIFESGLPDLGGVIPTKLPIDLPLPTDLPISIPELPEIPPVELPSIPDLGDVLGGIFGKVKRFFN